MKTTTKFIGLLALSLLSSFPALAQATSSSAMDGLLAQPVTKAIVPLSLAEKKTLLVMREEEKMARDVYQASYKLWKQMPFNHITESEQKHMDALLKKIKQFGLADSASSKAGVFNNMAIRSLYNQFVKQGKLSYKDALLAGATIEDMDIRDLSAAIKATNNLALKTTYQNLLEGSKKHLSAFVGKLQQQKITYKPKYISQALFDAILGV